jgi:hypothetical protein
MFGSLVACAAVFAILFMCASITKENTETAVKKQLESWDK